MDNYKTPLWELKDISKAFPGVQALDHVSFALYPGQVHALLGENGSGKSTLAKCLSGVHPPDGGQMLYQGQAVTFADPVQARAGGVATIYQEFSLIPSLSVAENIFLGRYPRRPWSGAVDWDSMRQHATTVLDQLALKIDPDVAIHTLSVAEQQLVEIAKAISMQSSLLIMDEPTAALGLVETARLMEVIRSLTSRDKAIIYISHRLDEVFQIADRVTILKDGKKVITSPVSDLNMGDVVRYMIGFEIDQHYPKERHARPENRLEIEGIRTENGVHDASFSIRAGEVFGLGGMLGSGRTEIAQAIFGLDETRQGKLRLDGQEVRFASPADAIRAGIGMIPENRKVDGCFFNFEAPKNITISRLRDLLHGGLLNLRKENKVGWEYIRKLNIHPTAMEKSVQFLSGGNQQKVIIARWLFSQARVLILDEPTQGIDIGAKLEIYKVINELTARGISILLITSDFPELLAMSDRVAVIRDGHVLYVAESERLTEFQLTGMASGVGLSEQIEAWMQLRKRAYPYLLALHRHTGAGVHLSVLDRQEMQLFYLEKIGGSGVPGSIDQSTATGPLHCTAAGKVLLAGEAGGASLAWIQGDDLPRFTSHTITDPMQLDAALEQVRRQGFGLDVEEQLDGEASLAVPLVNAGGEVIAAIGLTLPAAQLPPDPAHSPLYTELHDTAGALQPELEEDRRAGATGQQGESI
ncbi:MAG: ATP-binding cassette domain-containing protein [Anaerolineaceae bacterium]|nr:ATP-binding cassette domain-containing protein [Anaerolineaceae bacterium]